MNVAMNVAMNVGMNIDDSWQAALAAEHRAAFGYALLGPRLTGSERQLALTCFQAHEQVRDDTEIAIAAAGLTPVGPVADYPALYPVADAPAARRLAVDLEDVAAAAWRYLYSSAAESSGARTTGLRSEAQRRLTDSAVRAVRWRSRIDPAQATTPFPGI